MQSDTYIRWNSTYLMNGRVLRQNDILIDFYKEYVYHNDQININMNDRDNLNYLHGKKIIIK